MSASSVHRPVGPLRQRMLEDMAMRGLRHDTQRDYVRSVRSFAAFLKRPPDTATPEDIRHFQVHQAESGVQPQSINCSVSALRSFFTVTLDRPDLSRRFVIVRYPHLGNFRSPIRSGHPPAPRRRPAAADTGTAAFSSWPMMGRSLERHVNARFARCRRATGRPPRRLRLVGSAHGEGHGEWGP